MGQTGSYRFNRSVLLRRTEEQDIKNEVITEYKPPENNERYISLDHNKDRDDGDYIGIPIL